MGQRGIPTGDGAPPALPATMRAAHADSYGPPEALRIVKADLPRMGDRDVLIRVHAAAVCRADTLLVAGRPHMVRLAHGIRRPRHPVPGKSVSGVVAAVGAAVTTLRIGDPVFGEIPSGGFADFAAVPCGERPVARGHRHHASAGRFSRSLFQGRF